MAEVDNLQCHDEELLCGDCGAGTAEVVKDVVDVVEVFLNEFADAGVVGNGVIAAAGDLIVRCWTLDTAVVHEGLHNVGDLRLKHESNIIVENGDCIGLALWEACEANCTNWGLDHGEVPGCNIYGAVVIADKEVEHAVACITGHALNELVCERGYSGILDGDSIEQLEVVHEAQHAGLLLDAEPAGVV